MPGIPGVADADLIFERFFRGDAAVSGGSGLGLALVRESAQACSGDAHAISHSEPSGLEVIVSLPRPEGTTLRSWLLIRIHPIQHWAWSVMVK